VVLAIPFLMLDVISYWSPCGQIVFTNHGPQQAERDSKVQWFRGSGLSGWRYSVTIDDEDEREYGSDKRL
jgi:hypothetical protein